MSAVVLLHKDSHRLSNASAADHLQYLIRIVETTVVVLLPALNMEVISTGMLLTLRTPILKSLPILTGTLKLITRKTVCVEQVATATVLYEEIQEKEELADSIAMRTATTKMIDSNTKVSATTKMNTDRPVTIVLPLVVIRNEITIKIKKGIDTANKPTIGCEKSQWTKNEDIIAKIETAVPIAHDRLISP